MLRVHYGTVDANKERCFKSVCMRTIPSLQSQAKITRAFHLSSNQKTVQCQNNYYVAKEALNLLIFTIIKI